ncbi:hypothetical protein GUITHDRAFT_117764 [Guillardia theta CCMP2712]|uniref:EF-hand domain-containing protein n=1 Tax=Guillardia theta (strain CCMP2712) TaxID=905079 RepID=L1IJI8_GUITC|nr:hypothetical protein GUITHDRAFT_117764 [Guillardia theta CCMP2712]EKX36094.1 hypothetical protein GUITHDRAFT_117764 [Guillardia theta CCMP2712]|eukprot:XP_005823074.1 hypothetical protein GUITHDRAFT_117764 [Guillardia theta CCMP2712]
MEDLKSHSTSSIALLKRRQADAEKGNFSNFPALIIFTDNEGLNQGRSFPLRFHTEAQLLECYQKVSNQMNEMKLHDTLFSSFTKFRLFMRRMYQSEAFQLLFGFSIGAIFFLNCVQAELTPSSDSVASTVFNVTDIIFTAIFTFELALNIFVNWKGKYGMKFWLNGWNIFDTVIVIVSLLSLALPKVPAFTTLRMLRVFRAAQLFKRMRHLRVIFNAILGSLLPVLNSVLILVIVTSMFAIISVDLYGTRRPDLFGNFELAIFTMYQCATGDAWASSVARPLFSSSDKTVMIFFVVYMIISSMILLNVVVAVMLDNFIRCVNEEEQGIRKKQAENNRQGIDKSIRVLDPILSKLIVFDNADHFEQMVDSVFDRLDLLGSNSLSFSELQTGLKAFHTDPMILLGFDDFQYITRNVELGQDRRITREQFVEIFQEEFELYSARKLAEAQKWSRDGESPVSLAMKLALIQGNPEWYGDDDEKLSLVDKLKRVTAERDAALSELKRLKGLGDNDVGTQRVGLIGSGTGGYGMNGLRVNGAGVNGHGPPPASSRPSLLSSYLERQTGFTARAYDDSEEWEGANGDKFIF